MIKNYRMKIEKLLSQKPERERFISTKTFHFMVMAAIFTATLMCTAVYADALSDAKNLLSKGATAGGGLWAIWGLVSVGIAIKDHNGPGISNGIWQLIGGGIIVAAGALISNLDLAMS